MTTPPGPEINEQPEFVATTTWTRRKRHWSLASELTPYEYGGGGVGRTLCPHGGGSDQEATDAETAKWANWGLKSVVVADLPPCKVCDRLRQRRQERPSPIPLRERLAAAAYDGHVIKAVRGWLLDEALAIEANHEGERGNRHRPIVEHLRHLADTIDKESTQP